jgi:hypothetical protein
MYGSMMKVNLLHATLGDVSAALQSGSLSSVELVKAYLRASHQTHSLTDDQSASRQTTYEVSDYALQAKRELKTSVKPHIVGRREMLSICSTRCRAQA